jgi:hypothetical protein
MAQAILPPPEQLSRILALGDPTSSPPAIHPASSLPDLPGHDSGSASSNSQNLPLLASLLDEVQARVHGADFALVVRGALTCAESSILTTVDAEVYAPQLDAASAGAGSLDAAFGPRIRELPEPRARLAALLPAVARWAHGVVGAGYPNELVEARHPFLSGLACMLIHCFSELDAIA